MKVLILNGSFREGGNTETLLIPFVEQLQADGASVETVTLRGKTIGNCDACWACQYIPNSYGCTKRDDMYPIVEKLLATDCFILATPIYTWYCTPPMKAMLDRHFGLNKYYGDPPKRSLWAGKRCGIVATCGYELDYGTSPFEDGIKRLCTHSHLEYMGMLAVRDLDDQASFRTPKAIEAARYFAKQIMRPRETSFL